MNPGTVRVEDLPVLDTDVLVVGAGPTGLMAGVVLNRRGVPAIVVDRKQGPTRESRALAVQARTMEIYEQLGLVDAVLAGAFPVSRVQLGNSASATGPNFEAMQHTGTRFPGFHVFEQSRNEKPLAETLATENGDIRWQHRLIDLADNTAEPDGRVEALLEDADGALIRIRARWCIGADGASSAVRRELNLPFDGHTDEALFWVADIRDLKGIPDGVLAGRFGTLTFAVAFPMGPNGHFRLVALAPKDSITQDEALASADEQFGLTHGTVDWFSSYRVHHRVAGKFRVGSIFLAGDAAHVHSPVGGQGMNTGLQDAHNLALLLADVAQRKRDPQALAHYEAERRPVALTLVNVTDRAFGVIGRRSTQASLLRRIVGGVASRILPLVAKTPLGARLGGYLGQYRIHYHYLDGTTQPEWAQDPAVGRRVPPVGGNQQALNTLTWQLHTYGAGTVSRPDLPDWINGPHDFGPDRQGRLRSDRIYLIRPDQFVAASLPLRDNTADPAQLQLALAAHQLVLT